MQIICLGDSITDCNHLFEDFPLGNGYVQMLSEMFQKHTINISDTMQFKNYWIECTKNRTIFVGNGQNDC